MKKTITLILVIATFCVQAQTKDAALNKRLDEYLGYSKTLNIDLLLNYMYPKVFEVASKAQIKKALEAAYNNADLKISLDSISIGTILPIEKFTTGAFTKFDYNVKMIITLATKEYQDKKVGIFENFKKKFGEENVVLNAEKNTFYIYQTKQALAIKDNFSKNIWTFMGIEEDSKALTKIIPLAIKKKYEIN
jgi:hypothetical protein